MYDNEFRLIILLLGFFIILYIVFSTKNNRKYKVYKTRNYDIKKPIEIRSDKRRDLSKNINIPLTSSTQTKQTKNNITLSAAKPR